MKRLPVGIQTLQKIREKDAVYIDKTVLAVQLIEQYEYVFLARPRRFGKSLFLDTLKELFEGNKALFEGLAAEKRHDWSQRFPVIKISFGRGDFRDIETIKASILRNLEINEEKLGVAPASPNPAIRFDELIAAAAKKYGQKVVILIDEYDKPILDNLENHETADQARSMLRAFYTVIKDNDAVIRFAFLTGVSKFSKVSIFSGLNNLEDISLVPKFGAICGYTQTEMEAGFADYLPGVDLANLRKWYDGYNFLGENVYNPFDILLFFKNENRFASYWFETGTPNMLVSMIKKEQSYLPQLTKISAGDELLTRFDIDNINLITMLFQTGYLTIKDVAQIGPLREYVLGFPNLEVEAAFNNSLLSIFPLGLHEKSSLRISAYKALLAGDLQQFRLAIEALFAAIPYHNYSKNDLARYEGFYASVIYAWLASAHLPLTVEDCTNKGRIDMVIEMTDAVYIVEFKVDGAGNALAQIKERGYAEKFSNAGKKIILIGIDFDSEEKNIARFLWEPVSPGVK